MTDKTVVELIERAIERADHMTADAEMMDLEYAAICQASELRWGAFEADKNELTQRNHIIFMERKNALKRSIEMTREDAEHYRAVAEALKAIPMMKAVIARANNTLFGSWSFFMSKSGDDEPTEHHLSDEIDKLKEYGRKQYLRAEALTNGGTA
jgi:hypothetical protein